MPLSLRETRWMDWLNYQSVLKLRPHSATIYNQLGLIHAQRGEVDEALASYRMATEIDPKMAIAYLNMANSLFQLGRYLEAKDALESVIKIDPHNYVVWMNAGVMASSVGDLESGEKYFHLGNVLQRQERRRVHRSGQGVDALGDGPREKITRG